MVPPAERTQSADRGRAKQDEILDAALEVFASYGFARTSMAAIAEAAGMSRGGLYLHFDSKETVYATMLERTLTSAREAAFAALEAGRTVPEQLDGYLQRGWGDPGVWALTARHGADMIEAKTGYARDIADAHNEVTRHTTSAFLKRTAPAATSEEIRLWVEILMLSPVGLRYDRPSMDSYRQRLTELAAMVAGQIELRRS